MTDDNTLEASVKLVGQPWEHSDYYAEAEKWLFMFWNETTLYKQWFDCLDLSTTLELACGHGRHAQQAVSQVGKLILMDIFDNHLSVCQKRLQNHSHVSYLKGDGYSFRPVESASVTAIYCYDAMVHFSPDIVNSYLIDGARILKPQGMMLLHHSNYDTQGNNQHYGLNPHARNHMTYALFSSFAKQAGLNIISSMSTRWGEVEDLDRLTLLQKP